MGIIQITQEFGLAGTNSKAGRIQSLCVEMEAKVIFFHHPLESKGQVDQPPLQRIFIWVIIDIALRVFVFIGVILFGSQVNGWTPYGQAVLHQ
ncbi:MAG: hypothetical protein HQK60_11575 [Deltaproteobacteria bacterium]|nr:hypothetical protein [Deltaproteobacteria bacterium]